MGYTTGNEPHDKEVGLSRYIFVTVLIVVGLVVLGMLLT